MGVAEPVEVLGAVAGFCTTFAFVPQIVKIRKQGGRDLSYGVLLRAPSVILANAATSALIVAAMGMKAWQERRSAEGMVPGPVAERG